jgi:hypothetical protein
MPLFLLFLVGEAMHVYAVIIPTETRDYWIDKANGVETMTVWLGLVKASAFAIVLLIAGGIFMGAAFALAILTQFPFLAVSLLVLLVADIIILGNYRTLYKLSRQYSSSGDDSTAKRIVELSARNPTWINLAQLSILVLAVALLAAKFIG